MVKSFQYIYNDEHSLNQFIIENGLDRHPSLFIQAFVGNSQLEAIQELQDQINRLVPRSTLIGCSSKGQVADGKIVSGIVLSFTLFEKTKVKALLQEKSDSSKQLGIQMCEEIGQADTKAFIIFSSHLQLDVQEFLDGVSEGGGDTVIAGGVSSDLPQKSHTYVFTNQHISTDGFVSASLNGDGLMVHSHVVEEWQEVGPAFKVTKVRGHIVDGINFMKPIRLLEMYLGERFVKDLPDSSIEFPFLAKEKNDSVAVYIMNVLPNGSVELSQEVEEGQEVSFGFASVQDIIQTTTKLLAQLKRHPVETHYVYNCVARRRYISEVTKQELSYFNRISQVSGFFSYGEFGRKGGKPKLMAHSLTYLGLSEGVREPIKDLKVDFQLTPETDAMMSLTHLIHTAEKDIQELTHNIQISEEYYRSLFDNNTDFVYSTDLNGRFNSLNPSFIKTFGFTKDEILGKSALQFIREEDTGRVRRHFYRAMEGREQYYDLPIASKNGEVNFFQIKNIPITVNGECVGIFGIGRNVTKERQFEKKITQLAYYDGETDLPNKMKFREIVDEHISRAKKKKREMAVLFLDMDRFKMINDTLGHWAGDLIMKELAKRIQATLPKGAYPGRFSGDTFTVLLTKDVNESTISDITDAIMKTIKAPFTYQGKEFYISVSIGVGIFPRDGEESTDLLRNADSALTRAKSKGGNNTVYFSRDMKEDNTRKVEMEAHLRRAIDREELFVAYQPIMNISDRSLIGCESLLRWHHPSWGMISPVEFIPLAEETGLIYDIGKWVLVESCLQLKKWLDQQADDFYISVNVSAQQFQHPTFHCDVKEALVISGLKPEYLCLELTETIMLHDAAHTIEVMKSLADLGVKLAIDDFGTGYSSLSYLKHLPLHILKIDRSFVQNMNDHTPDVAIVQSIATMGKGLNMKVVAEGVETNEQFQLLKQLGCDYAQGFLIERPMSSDKMNTYLEGRNLVPSQKP
ncbi:EAL domain-containing protein [Rossellomorea sp. YZS02]|uniref:bifunctional diguanylate cyclase/phosphodiesterase n=1 Tax=Rossellomorea sp. YZS02 TaxID=3097358 RepID=UPI002A0BABCD|nr:EAL domain-containing protein [Rossellomorea sp. YZS02]MDX8346126.1 EAL domain-containing protein [Rossellomorea sp. YZS02]